MARVKPPAKVQEKKLKRAEAAVEILKSAAMLNVKDPYRKGSMIELPLKGEVVVGADIHGNRKNFQAILEFAQLKKHPHRHLVFLGDIIHSLDSLKSGKDFSCLVLEDLAHAKISFPKQIHLLLGNHELSEFQGRKIFKDGKLLNLLFTKGIQTTYGDKGARLYRQALNYFVASLPIMAKTQTKILISHSTPEATFVKKIKLALMYEKLSLNNKRHIKKIEEIVWGRDFSQETAGKLANHWDMEIFIVGHEKCEEGYDVPNNHHIILDSTDKFGTVVLFKLNQPYAQRGVVRQIRYIEQLPES